jgi:hypothetical protein
VAVVAKWMIDPRTIGATGQHVVYTPRTDACALAFEFRPVKG